MDEHPGSRSGRLWVPSVGGVGAESAAGAPLYGQAPFRVAARFVVIWTLLSLVAMLAIYAGGQSQQQDFARIAAQPVATTGVVTLSDPGNHNSFEYRYRVGGQDHYGGSYPQADVQPEASSLRVGQMLSVHYSRRDPGLSCACDPRVSADQNHWWQALLAGYFLTSFAAAAGTFELTRRRAQRRGAKLSTKQQFG